MDNKMVLLFVLVTISLVFSICSFVILFESHFVSVTSQPQNTYPTAMPQQTPSTNPHPSIIPTPTQITPTSAIPTATPSYQVTTSGSLTANVAYTPVNVGPMGDGQYLKISGSITNNGPNTAYNVGLDVLAIGHSGRLAFLYLGSYDVINATVPAASGIYDCSKPLTDSFPSLAPYQKITFDITVYPDFGVAEPFIDQVTITPVSNVP
ncbi:MAG: hypothetical protein NWE92_12755 [Candidatus Bathyarchaeota archaeon]|nr:hypothetical protein [Candidatus Bathyarchaeota archaeon]